MDAFPIPGEPGQAVVTGLLLALLATAAWTDLAQRRIPNLCSAGLLLLLPAWLMLTGSPAPWYEAPLALLLALLPGLLLWQRGILGGGDVKLAAVCAGFVGTTALLPFLLVTSLLGGALALVQLLRHRPRLRRSLAAPQPAETPDGADGPTVPYGVAIALAAAWMLLVPTLPPMIGWS